MKKRQYVKPQMQAHIIQARQHLLAGSGVRGVSGLEDEFYYDDTPGDGLDAY